MGSNDLDTVEDQDRRHRMVEEQLRRRGITDVRVLEAFQTVPRHRCVQPALRVEAYTDRPLPIGHEQTISQPYIQALMSSALDLRGDEQVLEVGTGSGYQTAVLSRLAAAVVSVERVPALAAAARRWLDGLGATNVQLHVGDGSQGWGAGAPYDGILVAAAASCVPRALLDQLRLGGRLVMPLGDPREQLLTVIRSRPRGKLVRETLCACVFVPLVAGAG